MNDHLEHMISIDARKISEKRWILFFLCYLACNVLLLALSKEVPWLARYDKLIIYLIYMSMAFQFCPLPTAWIILWAARDFNPYGVALLGAFGTCIANLNDYYIVNYLFKIDRIKQVKKNRVYQSAARWYQKAPFLTLSVASFFPIPVDLVRFLSVSTAYPRRLFTLATLTGRLPRYLLIAVLGHELRLSNKTIFIIFVVTLVIGAVRGLFKLREKYTESKNG
jgi:membrane protein YqaA with SNARE-associated domain